ncbi:MAG: hypothetical protein A3F67_12255 [Verrucomicrobia bacterium RIFCSPHIGHO2_12_FULL_41_10]|nr:MAG: hypothetical protein A3F67_12255 [Verrucomicrobia bacterium RIFCSPHIGHO2_12_FULL_41_10]
MTNLRIGYVPYSFDFSAPGDRRRFVYYARTRKLNFELADSKKKYDLVVLSENADLSVWSRYDHGRLIYDLIDSYLAIPKTNWKGLLRGAAKFATRQSRYLQLNHWAAVGNMCRRADAVICATEEQQQDISQYNQNVHTVLDVHTGVTQIIKTDYEAHQPFRIVWEGLPQTVHSLTALTSVFQTLKKRYDLELHVVTDLEYYRYLRRYGKSKTNDSIKDILPNIKIHPWCEKDCAKIITSCDLAVIPLALNDPFAVGKPENKLLLLWRLAMPVVTSTTPAYARAMQKSGVNTSCRTSDEWIETLERLIMDESERRRIGLLGKEFTEREVNEEKLLSRWDQVFSSVGFSFHGDVIHE